MQTNALSRRKMQVALLAEPLESSEHSGAGVGQDHVCAIKRSARCACDYYHPRACASHLPQLRHEQFIHHRETAFGRGAEVQNCSLVVRYANDAESVYIIPS